MNDMKKSLIARRREFLKTVALAAGGASQAAAADPSGNQAHEAGRDVAARAQGAVQYPRNFTGRQLAMIAFPLGGVAAGSLALGGRGQLRDWEIFNRPDKGKSVSYAFPSIWAQAGTAKPVARVLEARLIPPYEAGGGLSPNQVSGLTRLEDATFTGEYPLAQNRVSRSRSAGDRCARGVHAPHSARCRSVRTACGDPAVHVTNPGKEPPRSRSLSVENPVGVDLRGVVGRRTVLAARTNEYRSGDALKGLLMTNPEVGKELRSPVRLCGLDRFGRRQGLLRARLAPRQMVGEPAAVLGRFFRGRPTRTGGRRAQRRGLFVSAAGNRPRSKGRVHVRSRLAFPEPHPVLVRMAKRTGYRPQRDHRELLPRRFADAWEAAGVRRDEPAVARKAHAPVPGRDARDDLARRREGSGDGECIHAGDAHLFPHRGRQIPRVRRDQRHEWMLPRKLHPRLELRNDHSTSVPHARPLDARIGLRTCRTIWTGASHPPRAARGRADRRYYGRRRHHGPDHQDLHRLAVVGRPGVARQDLAEA